MEFRPRLQRAETKEEKKAREDFVEIVDAILRLADLLRLRYILTVPGAGAFEPRPNHDGRAEPAAREQLDEFRKALHAYFESARRKLGAEANENGATKRAWDRTKGKFAEVLTLLVLLRQLSPGSRRGSPEEIDAMEGFDPIELTDRGNRLFLSGQTRMTDTVSGLATRPDLVLATSRDPTPGTVVQLIECKCVKKLTASVLRNEFGKASDLKAKPFCYTIYSWESVRPKHKEAARRLGISVVDLREILTRGGDIGEHLADRLGCRFVRVTLVLQQILRVGFFGGADSA